MILRYKTCNMSKTCIWMSNALWYSWWIKRIGPIICLVDVNVFMELLLDREMRKIMTLIYYERHYSLSDLVGWREVSRQTQTFRSCPWSRRHLQAPPNGRSSLTRGHGSSHSPDVRPFWFRNSWLYAENIEMIFRCLLWIYISLPAALHIVYKTISVIKKQWV